MAIILGKDYYQDNDVVALSESLLGLHLCTRIDGLYTAGKIVETEAYRAPEDKASHAYGNRRTNRTETMFKSGGHAYIYLCYGIHHLFNVVTGPADTAHAILVRALEPSDGIDVMLERRNMDRLDRRLTNGPGSLTKAMGITTHWDGVLLDTEKNIWIEDRERRLEPEDVIRSPRVGVDYAAECALWNWRFRIKNNQWCSPAK